MKILFHMQKIAKMIDSLHIKSRRRVLYRDILSVGLICIAVLIFIYTLLRGGRVYGSVLDWASQHSVIPDYFRKLFYETGQLIPSLAPNLGAGENIYYISYYGLLSPVILLSYLFPFVEMAYYIAAVSIISIIADIILFFIWSRRRFDSFISTVLTVMFSVAGPIILHSHRHIMFIIYMPLLLIAFFCVDLFVERNIKTPLAITVFLIVMTSYFFSVSAIVCITVYAVFRYFECINNGTITRKYSASADFFSVGGKFALTVIVGILLSCILIVPTAFAIMNGRDLTNSGISLVNFLPTVNLNAFTFGSYSMGLSSFAVFSIIDVFLNERKHFHFISAVFLLILICPVFIYILNGFQYLDGKVLIPFIPLALLICGRELQKLGKGNDNDYLSLFVFLIVSAVGILISFSSGRTIAYVIDFIIVFSVCEIAHYINHDSKIYNFGAYAFLIVPVISCIIINSSDKLLSVNKYNEIHNENITSLVEKATREDSSICRTAVNIETSETPNVIYSSDYYTDTIYSSLHDSSYNRLYFDVFCNENSYRNKALMTRSKNVYFNAYMGNKYWITRDNGYIPNGYTVKVKENALVLCETEYTMPVGYSTDRLMSLSEFETLDYPERLEAILLYTIVDKELPKTDFKSSFKEIECQNIFEDCDKFDKVLRSFKHNKGDGGFTYTYKLSEDCKGKTIIVRFKVDNTVGAKSKDIKIKLNGVTNKLTAADWKYYNHNELFEYVISPCGENENELVFDFPDENFAISDFRLWISDSNEILSNACNVDAFNADKAKTCGDKITGTINVTEDGYFNLSFVYSKGYAVYIDGKKVDAECVDTCFLGFPITSGFHEIEIVFTAPGLVLGKILSLTDSACLFLLIALDVVEKKRRKANYPI